MNAIRPRLFSLPKLSGRYPASVVVLNRGLSQYVYDSFFASSPPDPTLWNNAIGLSQSYLTLFHDSTGLSLGWTIVAATIALRTLVTFPLLAAVEVNQDRLQAIHEDTEAKGIRRRLIQEIHEISLRLPEYFPTEKSKEQLLNKERKRYMKKQYAALGCHPLKPLVIPAFQLPLWFSFSCSLRNMSGSYVVDGVPMAPEAMATEGWLWISSLAAPDHSLILSAVLGLTYLALVEINLYKYYSSGTPLKRGGRARFVTNVLRFFSAVVMPFFAYLMPAAVPIYWTASGLVGLAHNFVLMSPRVRRSLGICSRASPHDTPYRDLTKGFKAYWKS